ncbi:zinc finger Ran-binding domain-containing protein 2-like [Dermacentor albipictus]|uniref:zinc finger Ran-binding domain-containing protein 2-like n=1 Tax=Dermacentor albipictus TaxID=60249 RepID=UPI0038FCE123
MAEQQLQHDKKSSKVTTYNGGAPAATDAARGRSRYRSRGHSQSQSRSRSRVRRPSKDQKQPRGRSRSGSRSLTQQKQPPKEPQTAWTKTPDHHTRKATANLTNQPERVTV